MDHEYEKTPLIGERGGHLAPSSEFLNEGGGNADNNSDAEDDDPLNDPDMLNKKKKRRKQLKKKRICRYNQEENENSSAGSSSQGSKRAISFTSQMTCEIWIIYIIKAFTSLIFFIDDLTVLLYCMYEYNMSQSEAGILFCISALCLFAYGLTISGFLIDKMGVKGSLMLGLSFYAVAKFFLIFTDNKAQLCFIMITLLPFGISIVFPCLILGVKKLTLEETRPTGFSIFYGAMILGAIFGGPAVDWIRHDYKTTTWHYSHTNVETGEQEDRVQEFSSWRTICFVGFCMNVLMIILLCFYDSKVEERFQEQDIDWDEINKLTFCQIFRDLVGDYKFWRFMLFSFIIVGPKLVFSLLFFMMPRIIMQDYGEDAPFGIYLAIAPILIIIFLFCVSPLQTKYDAYDLILLGCIIATTGPIPMFFGMNVIDFVIFILIISFAEALYSPMLNVFTFNFTKPGREGTFLTLTAAPIYFTMAITGLMGGYLLENFYPAEEDEDHKKQPQYIWLIIMVCSATSTIILLVFSKYFRAEDDEPEENQSKQNESQDKIKI